MIPRLQWMQNWEKKKAAFACTVDKNRLTSILRDKIFQATVERKT